MNIIISDTELFIIFMTILFSAGIACAAMYYTYRLYRQKQIVYPLFAARDAFIRCVATGAIKKEDPLFSFFYSLSNDLISVVHTDFFSINKYVNQLQKYEKQDQMTLLSKKLITEIKRQPEQFQQAVDQLSRAMIDVFIEKNLFFKILVKFRFFSLFIKLAWKALNNEDISKNKKIVEQKNYYEEMMKINNFRQNLNFEPLFT